MTNEITKAWAEREKEENTASESKIIMPLKEYTDMMIEDADLRRRLKVALSVCERKAREALIDNVSTYSIGCLKKESCEDYLKSSDERLLSQFSYYSSLKEVFADYPCFGLDELKAWTVEFIRDEIRKRLVDTKEQEENQ